MTHEFAIEVNDLCVSFRDRRVLNSVTFKIPRRTTCAFLGLNGAGKTTTIRAILGIIPRERGRVSILGQELDSHRLRIMRQVGCLIGLPALYPHLTGWEHLQIDRRLYGVGLEQCRQVLETVSLFADRNRLVRTYSQGMRQRLGVARALLHEPEVLVLDEPTNGFDPSGMEDFRILLKELVAQGKTVFLSSHHLGEVERTAQFAVLIHQGQILLEGPIGELLSTGEQRLSLAVSDPTKAIQLLTAAGCPARRHQDRVEVEMRSMDSASINRYLVTAGVDVAEAVVLQASLESIFMKITGRVS